MSDMDKKINQEKYIKALLIALDAHQGQKRSDGDPYISHPLRVAHYLNERYEKIVALLHDVLEDSDFTEEDLKEISPFIAEKVKILTHKEDEDYFDYIRRIKKDDLCAKIKLLDIIDNLTDKPKKPKKYREAIKILINK